MNSYSTGDYVRAGTGDDFDIGRIVEILEDGRLFVAWTLGKASCEVASDLSPSTGAHFRALLEATVHGE